MKRPGNASLFARGLFSPFAAVGFVFTHPGIIRYLLLPLAVTLTFFVFVAWLWWRMPHLTGSLTAGWLPSWLGWAGGVIHWLAFAVAACLSFTLVGSLIASPFCDILSRKVLLLRGLRPIEGSGGLAGILRPIKDAAAICLLKVPVLLASLLVPGGPLLCCLLFAAFDFLDYPWSHFLAGWRAKFGRARRDSGLVFGLALSFGLPMLIPFMAVVVIPLGVLAASLCVEQEQA